LGVESSGRDLLQLFMEYRDEEGKALNDRELRDVVLNFIIAGRDTTAQALSWLVHFCLDNPNKVDKLNEESNSLAAPSYETVREHSYAQALFNETLRLRPSVPKNLKTALGPDLIPTGNGPDDFVRVEKGDNIFWVPYAMGQSKAIWGEDASAFNPERWIDENGECKRESPFKYPVFHAGPRTCLGQLFATHEALTLFIPMFQQFAFERAPDVQPRYMVKYDNSLTLPMKDGLVVRCSERH